MGASSSRETSFCESSGLISAHAYALIDARELDTGDSLVRLRNPWGSTEWNGAWSDKSKELTPAIRTLLRHVDADDGSFWMSLQDFYRYFTTFDFVRIFHDEVGIVYRRYLFKDQWKIGVSAGGAMSHPSWKINPQFGLTVSEPTTVYISLHKSDPRMGKKLSMTHQFHSVHLWKVANNTSKLQAPYANNSAVGTPLHASREVVLELEDLPPSSYLVSAQMASPSDESDIILTIYSDRPVQVFSLQDSSPQLAIHQSMERFPTFNPSSFPTSPPNSDPSNCMLLSNNDTSSTTSSTVRWRPNQFHPATPTASPSIHQSSSSLRFRARQNISSRT